MFSVTPEPAVSPTAYGSQARQPRAGQPSQDGFAALVDDNAAAVSDAERQSRPVSDAPRRRDRADAPAKSDGSRTGSTARRPSETAASGSTNPPATTDQPADPAKTATEVTIAAAAGKKGDAVLTPGEAIVSDDAGQAAGAEGGAAPAIAADAQAIALVLPVAPAAANAEAAAGGTGLTVTPDAPGTIAPAVAAAASGTDQAFAEATANAIAGQPVEADGSAPTPEKVSVAAEAGPAPLTTEAQSKLAAASGETGQQSAEAPATPAAAQAARPETDPSATEAKPEQRDKAASESVPVETNASERTAKLAPQAERAAAPAPLQVSQPDPGLPAPAAIPQQPVQTHAANLTAIPVPVSTPLTASLPVPLNGLALDIALRAAGGNSRFEIRLDPAELGRIDVRLDVDKLGNVTSHLTVERPATLDMLRNDAPKLQQALEDAGLKTGDGGLQFSLRDQSSSGRDSDSGSGRNAQRLVIAEDDTVSAQVAGRTYGRMSGSGNGIDIRI